MTNGERITIAVASYTRRSGREPRAELGALLTEIQELLAMPVLEGDRLVIQAIVDETCRLLMNRAPDRITQMYTLRDRLRDRVVGTAGVSRG
jgi:hypothetical protein